MSDFWMYWRMRVNLAVELARALRRSLSALIQTMGNPIPIREPIFCT